jgi:hypothetical protein
MLRNVACAQQCCRQHGELAKGKEQLPSLSCCGSGSGCTSDFMMESREIVDLFTFSKLFRVQIYRV